MAEGLLLSIAPLSERIRPKAQKFDVPGYGIPIWNHQFVELSEAGVRVGDPTFSAFFLAYFTT